jgi:hypothetical protein
MALLFIDSFDHYQSPNVLSKWTRQFIDMVIGIGDGRCGSNSLHIQHYDLVKGLAFDGTHGTIGFAAWFNSFDIFAEEVIGFTSVGDADGVHLWLRQNPDGSLQVVRTTVSGYESLGITGPNLINENHWYFIEWQVLIHPTNGAVTVRLNNIPLIAVTGVNTVGDGRAVSLRQIAFHCGEHQGWRMDDLYVLDDRGLPPLTTFLGDVKVEYLRPRTAGTHQDWAVVGGSSHTDAIDDNQIPDDDASYIESATPGETDTSLYQPTALPAGPIFGAQLSLYARKSDSGPRVIAPVVNDEVGAPFVTVSQGSYQYHHTAYGLNPATDLPWTIAEINAIEAGVTVVS